MPKLIPAELTDREVYEIQRIWSIERHWWNRWHELVEEGRAEEHWSMRGEDGFFPIKHNVFGTEIEKNVRVIDMRDVTFFNPLTQEQESVGWVECERILPWRPGVAPTAINWFAKRFFGTTLFGYQLYFYYLCQPNMLLVGGRGSAKTKGLAVVMASWVSLHPGQGWAHFAYTGAQAMEAYYEISDLGTVRYPLPGEDYNTAAPSWWEVFVASSTVSPYGKIRVNSWSDGDPGTELIFRPLGQQSGATTTRSIDVRRTSIDECTYDIEDTNILSVAEASARGTNTVVESWLPAQDREEVAQAKLLMAHLDEKERSVGLSDEEAKKLKEIERTFRELGISCHLTSIRTGNRGAWAWIDQLLQKSSDEPIKQWSAVVSFLVNPHLDRRAREKLLTTYDDEIVARTELFAERPMGRGLWFTAGVVTACESEGLSQEVLQALAGDESGYIMERYGPHLHHWQRPYRQDRIYVLGCDPGTQMLPHRDSWNVQVWELDLDVPVATLAYWKWGNTTSRQKGSWNPFLTCIREAMALYHITPQNVVAQVGGQEKGIAETAFGSHGSSISVVVMTENTKGQMANYARQLMASRFMRWPKEAADLSSQLTNWEWRDQTLSQDLVMATFAASWMLFQYLYRFLPSNTAQEVKTTYVPRQLTRRTQRRVALA